jgi:signal transduction histidine kinase
MLGILEAILAWQREPNAEGRGRLSNALGELVSGIDARGAYLEADPAVLPGLSVGYGSLKSPPRSETGSIRQIGLFAGDGTSRTGSLWLDSGATAAPEAVRAVELALEAAWSRAEVNQTAEQFEALDAATRGIAGVLTLDRVLQLIVDRVRDLIGAQYAALGIVDERGVIERFVTSGITPEQRKAIGPLPRGQGLLGLIIRENRSYRSPDIAADPNSSGFPAAHPPMHSFLGVPIQVKARSVGNFYLTNKRNAAEFSDSDLRLVEMFALHAGVAIDNARLHEQVQQLAVLDERDRIGKDLHDGIIQSLYAVGLSLEDVPDLMQGEPEEAAARVDRAIDSINVTIRDLRNFIFGLRPELVEEGGLLAGLAALVDELRLNTVIDAELEADESIPDLAPDRRAEVLKVVRESLSNIARHSNATRATVALRADDDDIEIVDTDNGEGFVVDEERSAAHQGLHNIRARIRDLGGRLAIDSVPGLGTRIIVRIPASEGTRDANGGHRGQRDPSFTGTSAAHTLGGRP